MAKGFKTGGRAPGSPNKITTQLKEAILEATERAGDDITPGGGSVAYLKHLAVTAPQAFAGLLGRVLPLTVVGDPDAPLRVVSDQPVTAAEWIANHANRETAH